MGGVARARGKEQLVIKSLALVFMAVILIITNLFTSFAEVDGSADNNNQGSNVTGAGGDFGCNTNTQGRIGVRFSLVDASNPEKVVSIDDDGNPLVIDVWFMNRDKFAYYTGQYLTPLSTDKYFRAVKTQSIDTVPDNQKIRIYTWDMVENEPYFANMPHWMTYNDSKKVYNATGLDLQAWEEAVVDVNGEALKYGNILNMLRNWVVDGNLVFKTAGTKGKTVLENGQQMQMSVANTSEPSNRNYKLLIESIIMFTPVAANTTSSVLTNKVAGTFGNIGEYWQTNTILSTLEAKLGVKSYLNWKAFNQTGVHALSVSDSVSDYVENKVKMVGANNEELGEISYLAIVKYSNILEFKNGDTLDKATLSAIPTWGELAQKNKWVTDGETRWKDGFGCNAFSLDGMSMGLSSWDGTDEPNKVPDGGGNFKIVKYYEDSKDNGVTYETSGVYGNDKCDRKVTISNEKSYEVKEFFMSTSEASYTDGDVSKTYGSQKGVYNDLGTTGSGTGSVEVKEPVKVLHILLQKKSSSPVDDKPVGSANLVLYQNEMSRPYSLENLAGNTGLMSLYETFADKSGLTSTCNSKHYRGDDCRGNDEDGYYCGGNHRETGYSTQTDGSYHLGVADSFDYNSGTTFIRDYITADTEVSGSLGLGGGQTEKFNPNAGFIYYRDKSRDKVTLYTAKNSEAVKQRVAEFGVTGEGYIPAGTRYEKESPLNTGSVFNTSLVTHFVDTTADRSLGYTFECEDGHRFGGNSYDSDGRMFISELNERYSKSNNGETKVYVGQQNRGIQPIRDLRSKEQRPYNDNFSYANTEAALNFYPYVKMKTIEKDGAEGEVYITSENQSIMRVFNSIQTGVYKRNRENANLTSTQWSTHMRSMKFLNLIGVSDKKSVLPGGAMMDIDMGQQGDTQVGIRLYQAALPDEQVGKVASKGSFSGSVTQARESARGYLDNAIEVIGGYGLVLRGLDEVKTKPSDFLYKSQTIRQGDWIPFDFGNMGFKVNEDAKYYLRQDGEGSSRANFDVLGHTIKDTYYTITSDTDGNVMVYKDGVEIGRINKLQSASDLLKTEELSVLDTNTMLITNYISAIDRNKGRDANGVSWYNEAWDGVGVLVTDITIDVGFNVNSAVRSTALDPLLMGLKNSKSELYSFEPEQTRTLGYYTTMKSSAPLEDCKNIGYLGTLKGNGNMMDIKNRMNEIESFVFTKLFYLNNFSVSDLN